jgi:diguanylate cyclase (GGDEF)-like protein
MRLGSFARSHGSTADLGWVFVISTIVLSLPTVWSLPEHQRMLIIGSMAGGLVVATAARALPWEIWNRRALLIWPLLVLAGLTGATLVSPRGTIATLSGLITISFLYVGVTQRPWTSFAFLPLAIPVWILCAGGWNHQLAVKAPIAVGIWVIVAETISRLRERVGHLTATLERQTLTDPLTGLASRRALDVRLETVAAGDAVVFIDLDFFKVVNDRDGHSAGDKVLSDLGETLRASVRGNDLAARFGGEEFLLILGDAGIDGALLTLERIKRRWSAIQPAVTFSAGIAEVGSDLDATAAISAADGSLYRAKQDGRNRWEISVLAAADEGH